MSDAQEITKVKVWDPLVRIGHWTIVVGFFTAYLTGDEFLSLHLWAGYAVAIVVAVRIVWGFIGTKHARFSSFIRGPQTVISYISGMRSGRAKRYIGHNPAGAAMIVALLFSLTVTAISGMALLAAEDGRGPLSGIVATQAIDNSSDKSESLGRYEDRQDEYEDRREHNDDEGASSEELLEFVHSAFTYLTLILVALHILGVIASSIAHKENLVRAMVTGRKRQDE